MLNHQSSILVDFAAAAAAAAAGKGKRSEKEGEKEKKTHEDNEGPEKYFSSYFFLKEIDHFETKNQILGQDYLSRINLLSWQQTEISEEV